MFDRILIFTKAKSNLVVALLWGLAEGIFFFIIPDVYLGFVALFSMSGALNAVLFSVIGALISAGGMFWLVSIYGSSLNSFLLHIPGINEAMIQTVSSGLETRGLTSLIDGPLNGIPYKIYSVNAALQNFPLIQYLLLSIPARLERILPVTIFAITVGVIFKKSIRKYTKYWVIFYLILWILIYAFYYTKIVRTI